MPENQILQLTIQLDTSVVDFSISDSEGGTQKSVLG